MQVRINGKQIDIGDALRSHVTDRLPLVVTKYFDRPVDAEVTFSRDRHSYRCDASVHLSSGLTAQSHALSADIYAAFDQGAEKIEKQLRRYKRRLKDHHANRREADAQYAAATYVLSGAGAASDADDAPDGAQPPIIAEMSTDIPSLTVGDAVMQMELGNRPFLMFRNDANGRFNIVFHRDDGNIGWIDPANLSAR